MANKGYEHAHSTVGAHGGAPLHANHPPHHSTNAVRLSTITHHP